MSDVMEAARAFLEETGLDPTLNRILVLSAMGECGHPLTAKQVYERVLETNSINRVTVYRILDLFEEKGVVNKISTGERGFSYCSRQGPGPAGHSHFHCIRCGEVRCIDNALLHFDTRDLSLPREVVSVDLRLDGVCRECRIRE